MPPPATFALNRAERRIHRAQSCAVARAVIRLRKRISKGVPVRSRGRMAGGIMNCRCGDASPAPSATNEGPGKMKLNRPRRSSDRRSASNA